MLVVILYIITFLILLVLLRKKILTNYLTYLSLAWFFTFPFKYLLYEYYPETAVGGFVDIHIRNESLIQSYIYFLLLLIFYVFFSKVKIFSIRSQDRFSFSKINPFYLHKIVRTIFFISLGIYLYTKIDLLLSGNLIYYLANRVSTGFGNGFTSVFGSQFLGMSILLLLFNLYYMYSIDNKYKRKLILWSLFTFFITLSFILIEATRGRFISYILIHIVSYHIFIKRISLTKLFFFGGIIIFIFGLLSRFKYILIGLNKNEVSENLSYLFVKGLLVSFDSMDHLDKVNLKYHEFINNVQETIFQPLIDAVIFFIPRVIWSDKPLSLGGVALQKYIYPEFILDNGVVKVYYSVSIVGEAMILGNGFGLFIFPFIITFIMFLFIKKLNLNNHIHYFMYLVLAFNMFNIIRAGLYGFFCTLFGVILFYIYIKLFYKLYSIKI